MTPSLSICCIDAIYYGKTVDAVNRTLSVLAGRANVTAINWLSNIDYPAECPVPVKWTKIKPFTDYMIDYNYAALKLLPHVATEEFNLIVHWDGYAVNPNAWTTEFYSYDYIGARWNDGVVGNGGFSLRSRALMDALLDANIDHTMRMPNGLVTPEDMLIGRTIRNNLESKYNMKFAPGDLANRFSIEAIENAIGSPWLGQSLGFHGPSMLEWYGK